MPNKIHRDMVMACKERLSIPLLTDNEQRSMIHSSGNRKQLIPDLVALDRTLAVECCTAFRIKSFERMYKYSKEFQEIIITMPFIPNVNQIWMYDGQAKEFYTFRKVDK